MPIEAQSVNCIALIGAGFCGCACRWKLAIVHLHPMPKPKMMPSPLKSKMLAKSSTRLGRVFSPIYGRIGSRTAGVGEIEIGMLRIGPQSVAQPISAEGHANTSRARSE
jgi:hypothetical protein